MAQSRDKDTTNFKPSRVLVDTLCVSDRTRPEQAGLSEPGTVPGTVPQVETGGCLQFEMLTSLVGGGPATADLSLMRHTLVQVADNLPGRPGLLAVCPTQLRLCAPSSPPPLLPGKAQVLPDTVLVLWATSPAEKEATIWVGRKAACRNGAAFSSPRAAHTRGLASPAELESIWHGTQAGAQQTAWASGTGEVLKGAAATFAARAPSS